MKFFRHTARAARRHALHGAALVLAAAFCLTSQGTASAAPIVGADVPIPDAYVLVNFNGTGLDWVYAGPVAPNEFGPGNIETPDYRAAEGWRYATEAEWAIRPDWTDFIMPGYTELTTSGYDHAKYRYASEYWGNFDYVDLSDATAGYVTNGLDIGCLTCVHETWYVRGSDGSSVPEPASVLLVGAALGGLLYRRRGF